MIEINGKTKQEVEQEKINQEWQRIRNKRDSLLKETDYLIMPDYPLDTQSKSIVQDYRQQLRDLPEVYSDPFEVIFPEKPSFI